MHDLYHFAQGIRALGTARSLGLFALVAGAIYGGTVLWSHENEALRWVAFALFQIVGTVVAFALLSDPVQWLNYIVQKLVGLLLGLVRIVLGAIKIILVGILYLIYLIVPVDLIPGDFFTLIGLIDDVIIGLFFFGWAHSAATPVPPLELSVNRVPAILRWIGAAAATFALLFFVRQIT
jgi:hypothetical protein